MEAALRTIKDQTLTYHQQLIGLAGAAESTLNVLNIDTETRKLIEDNIICTLHEGNAPYRPRYIVPDYELLMEKGCSFLQLEPPKDIWEAINNLLIFYKHVPSITSFPVYLGNIDTLIDPFIKDECEARKAINFFLKHIDRTLTDSFVHANIGPKATEAGRLILEEMQKLQCAMPNLTAKLDLDITGEEFAKLCASTALNTAKPSFANHKQYVADFKNEDYAIVSCYNGFHIGGGGYTLQRLLLSKLAQSADSIEDYIENKLPWAAKKLLSYIDERIRFLVEESAFFKSSFLVKEGFIKKELFTGMFGIVGLAEAVNYLLKAEAQKDRFGHSEEANELGMKIITKLSEVISGHKSPYVDCFDGNHVLHAQVGIDTDFDISPGCRIPVGEEPELFEHIIRSAPFHKYFYSGIGDIFVFEDTYQKHPEALVDVVKGAFSSGIRYLSAYGSGCDVVRVTGYLVKRSEVERLENGEAVMNNATVFGLGAKNKSKALDRRIRS